MTGEMQAVKLQTVLILFFTSSLIALPQGAYIQHGKASISSSNRSMLIGQESDKVILHWDSFHLEQGERLCIAQPSKEWAMLHRVMGNEVPSRIDGQLVADGRVFLINPAGVIVGSSGQIRTGAFLASTFQLSNEAFLENRMDFYPEQWTGSIVNFGSIVALEGDVQLIGATVVNKGIVSAQEGSAVLSGWSDVLIVDSNTAVRLSAKGKKCRRGEEMQADLDAQGGSALGFAINCEGIREVSCSGKIEAAKIDLCGDRVVVESGAVLIAGRQEKGGRIRIDSSLSTSIEKQSYLQASALERGDGGEIFVWSDCDTTCLGSFEACGGPIEGNGGVVEISSQGRLKFEGDVNTTALNGTTGLLLFDPSSIVIDDFGGSSSPSFPTSAPGTYDPLLASCQLDVANVQTALASNNVTVLTSSGSGGSGDITINKGFTWNAQTTFTAVADRSISIANDLSIASTFTGSGSAWTAVDLQANQGAPISGQFRGVTIGRRSSISSAEGNIQILGKGGDSGNLNYGIYLRPESSLQSTGTGANAATITLTASSSGLDGNSALFLDHCAISSSDGNIDMTGSSTGTGNYNHGISCIGSSIGSTGSSGGAAVTMLGTSSNGFSANSGISFDNNTIIFSVAGDIFLTGTTTSVGNYCRGIDVKNSAVIESIGAGPGAAIIVLNGTGGTGVHENHGVSFKNDSDLESIDGNIQITGVSHGSGNYNRGIQVMDNSTILSTGNDMNAADITLTGTGGSGSDNVEGIYVDSNAQVSAVAGTVIMNG